MYVKIEIIFTIMKKLVLLLSVMFLVGSVAFAQSEKTVKQEKKDAKVESVNKQAKPATNKEVKAESTEKVAAKPVKQDDKKPVNAKPAKPAVGKDAKSMDKQAKPEAKPKAKPQVKPEVTNQTDGKNNDATGGPEISFKETKHDFGTIPFKGNGSYEFVFVNTGNEPLILTQPKSSCGCTVPEWPKEPILPGASNVIKVTYKNTNKPGNFNKYVTVFSNAVVNKEVKLYIKGTVEPEPTDAAPLMNSDSPVKNN